SRLVGDGWRGRRAARGVRPAAWPTRSADRHNALLIGRYRYAMVLGFSEVVVAQWIQVTEDEVASRRDAERERLRVRLASRLAHYPGAAAALEPVTPVLPDSDAERRRLAHVEASLRGVARRALRLADRGHRCATEHDGFAARVRVAAEFEQDPRPASALVLHGATKSLLAAMKLCPAKDWGELRDAALGVLGEVRPRPAPQLGVTQVLEAQRAFQRASLVEVEQLRRDHRWFTGRRRRGNALTQRSLRVGRVAATLRLARVEWLIAAEAAGDPSPPADGSSPRRWPPDAGVVNQQVQRALGRNPFAVLDWQDLYNAACVSSIPLLPLNNWAGQRTGHKLAVQNDWRFADPRIGAELARFSRQAVRALERAADSSDSHFTAGQRTWVTFADPDLVGFRASDAYALFRARNLASASPAVPVPKNVHVLQLSAYVTGMLRALARELARCACDDDPALARDDEHVLACLDRDHRAWQQVRDACQEQRDWRARRELLQFVRTVGRSSRLAVEYPSFPSPLIGDLADVSNRQDSRLLTIAGRYARQERVDQLVRIQETAARFLATGSADAAFVAASSGPERARFHARRRRAWEVLERCLEITFFTDSKTVLHERKAHVARLEEELRSVLAPPATPPVRGFAAPDGRRLEPVVAGRAGRRRVTAGPAPEHNGGDGRER
ncbi:hypothetical protein ACXR2U_17430, partial [Jatrophihabitans sp. YIM 134969]